MIYVSLDPEGLQRVITGLSNYGTKARECRESVKNTNDRNDSPTDLASSLDIIRRLGRQSQGSPGSARFRQSG